MKKLLESDNALKVISVLAAICIWIYIAIVMDPPLEVTVRDLPIQFVGQDSLSARDLAVISKSATTVTVKVKGSRKKMGNYDMKTIIAKTDVSTVSEPGVFGLPVEVVVPFENQGISSQSLYAVDVKVEKVTERNIGIEVRTTGSLAQNYMAGDIIREPASVTVRGPESAVEQISKAVVTLDYKGADVDIDNKLPITYFGEDNKELIATGPILKRIKPNVTEIDIHCPVLKIYEVPPIAYFGDQTLPEDFDYKIEPSELYIYGDDPKVSKTEEILTEQIPLGKLLENDKVKVKLNIPEGVKILYDIAEVEISVKEKD